ncbi:MAG: 16S rRNA (adenine(1518)-N(6)/adenine(1519)-N(6))-dimethyltransferase RsmA [Thiotrichales bacterium]|jgi:16S rRNA (adenine1518-N6/adenine1519-N6)-dimethyltransferase|nr:16S rRNA (adenine(1518)-N(6)/adenine(1519)-N(6))-dimethyltransferase RsmA [Thiotrichales bacterium]
MSHQHKKRFGQHFLQDQSVLDAMSAAIAAQPNDVMLEIGPGEGALTERLIDQVSKFTVVEIDNDLIPTLNKRYGSRAHFHILHQDALTVDYGQFHHCLRVVGNLPYNISTPLIFKLLESRHAITDMHFMLQKEVVERLASEPDGEHYGRLSVMAQYYCAIEDLFHIGPEAFDPPPKVDSAVVRLTPYRQLPFIAKDEVTFARTVKQCFSMRRKTLRNNLKGLLTSEQIEACEINPGVRAEVLSVAEFVRLSDAVSNMETR